VRIATWNVNSVRARLESLLTWLEIRRPDVVCLQETKCADERFPREEFEALGYQIALHGQRTYNGVALLSRRGLEDVVRGVGHEQFDCEARVVGAQVEDFLVLSVYAVNGVAVGHDRFEHKLRWFAALREFLVQRYPMEEKVVLCGDLNVTPDDRDVWDPVRWRERILCSTAERQALAGILGLGFRDALRKFRQEGGVYTWWDYRLRGFERGWGLRIDHVLLSPPAYEACTALDVDVEARGQRRPSDHAPVVATFGDGEPVASESGPS
jgi:exodeoxyribonuclease-3